MKAAVLAFTRRGCALARQVAELLPEAELYTLPRFDEPGFLPLGAPPEAFYGELFSTHDALVFVGAAGIAVRSVAPHIRDKRTDPAVLCLDEGGRFVVPLLGGHIGGANALALRLSGALGAAAAITTATDVNRRFSVDRWAAEAGCAIADMGAAKAVSAAILERDIPFMTDLPVKGELPPGLVRGGEGALGVYIGWDIKTPFNLTLRLVPRCLRLGLGCRRGVDAAGLRTAVETVFEEHRVDPRAVRAAASIDLKRDEQGLADCCALMGWPLSFYSAERLRAVPGQFSASALVERVTGVDNVCERAAMLGAERLVVEKTALDGVTVAAAAEHWEVCFGETVCGGHRPG